MEKQDYKKGKQFLFILLLLLLWGSFSAGSKLAQKELDVFQLNFFMYLCGFGVCLLLCIVRSCFMKDSQPEEKITIEEWKKLALCGGLIYGYFFFYNIALSILTAVTASILNYTFPLFILFFDHILNRRKKDRRKIIAAALGMAGVIVVLSGGSLQGIQSGGGAGIISGISGAFCWGLFSVISTKIRTSILKAHFIYMLLGLILSLTVMLLCSEPVMPSGIVWLYVLWLGGFAFVLSNLLWVRAMVVLEAGKAAAISFLTPFVNLLFVGILLGEKIGGSALAGLLLILCGICITCRKTEGMQIAGEKDG